LASRAIIINKKKYAIDMFWQPVPASKNARQYAKSLDSRANAFVEYKNLVGVARRKSGFGMGVAAAAPDVMAKIPSSSYLAAFSIGGGFWITAARNNVIIVDEFLESEPAAKSRYWKLLELPDWGALYAPDNWRAPKAGAALAADFLTGKYQLRSISRFKINLAGILILFALLFGAWHFLQEPIMKMISSPRNIAKVDAELAAEYKRRIELRDRELDDAMGIVKKQPAPVIRPFDNLQIPDETVATCWKAIGYLMQQIPGWRQTGATCDGRIATATLVRDYGTLGEFYQIGDTVLTGASVSELSESKLEIRVNLPEIPVYSGLNELDAESVSREINSRFQSLRGDVMVRNDAEKYGTGERPEFANFVIATADSKLTPGEFIKIFSDFDGLAVKNISWDLRKKTWNYEVIVYVK
jgi:hypothetical protein